MAKKNRSAEAKKRLRDRIEEWWWKLEPEWKGKAHADIRLMLEEEGLMALLNEYYDHESTTVSRFLRSFSRKNTTTGKQELVVLHGKDGKYYHRDRGPDQLLLGYMSIEYAQAVNDLSAYNANLLEVSKKRGIKYRPLRIVKD
jgi:hypothetical protein